jgi:hypothetical protein
MDGMSKRYRRKRLTTSFQKQLEHVAEAVLHGIHDVFPANIINEEDPISFKKIMKGEGVWALQKDILGFTFDGQYCINGSEQQNESVPQFHFWNSNQ